MQNFPTDSILASLFRKVDKSAALLEIPEWLVENEIKPFKWPEINSGKIRVNMDDGSYVSFSAFISLHCNPYTSHEKPYKGGVRLSHLVFPGRTRTLAFEMTMKCGVVDLEFGGGKAGIQLKKPITQYSDGELHRIIEAFATVFIGEQRIISPRYYTPATDMGTTPQHMDIIHNKFWEITKGTIQGAPVTGRSVENGGIPGREEATALGGLVVLEKLRKAAHMPKLRKKPTVIVQGLGQVGGNFVELAAERDYKIVGVSNVSGAVLNKQGIDLEELPRKPNGQIDPNASLDRVSGQHCAPEKIITGPCDILVPAAMENTITAENAGRINCKVLLELANHPTSEEADIILSEKGVYIIPDIFANAGGVSASFWEWSLSFGHPRHSIQIPETLEEVRSNLTAQMEDATSQILEYATKYDTDLRGAAWLKAMDRISSRLIKKHGGRWAPKTHE